MELRRIMVGVDFSEHSDRAVRTALALARRFGASVHLVHVYNVSEWPVLLYVSVEEDASEIEHRHKGQIAADRLRFRELRERLGEHGVKVHEVFKDGAPAWSLVDAAREIAPDLVVVGSRGLGRMRRLLLGSVAERVARRSPAPVLVVRETGEPASGFQRVVIGTDFSDPSIRALELARYIASDAATFDLINCWRIPGSPSWDDGPETGRAEADSLTLTTHAQVEEAGIAWMKERTDPATTMRFHLLNQKPARGIQDWIQEHDVDLVVLGSHGQQNGPRPVLGDVASSVLRRVPCSVLIAR